MVKHEGRHIRPWLTAFQDVRSRRIVGWTIYAHDPNSDVIITALRQSLLDCGAPTDLMVDNGKDFDCKALNGQTKKERRQKRYIELLDRPKVEGLFQELGINVGHCWVYHGQSKPIERWFGFVESRTRVWDTYCGDSPANKPEDLEKFLAKGHAPTLAEFADWFDEWVRSYNAGHQHHGDGMEGKTPDAVWEANLQSKRVVSRELLDVLCLKKIGPVKVMQNGVTYQSLRYGQYATDLMRRLGKSVCLRVDERDIRQVQVYEAETDKFICIAPCNARLPMKADAALLRGALSEKKSDRRTLKKYYSVRPGMVQDLPDRMLRRAASQAAAARAENPPPSAPPSIQPVRHPLEECLPDVARAMARRQPLKRAVGAESMSGEIDLLSAATMAQLDESERARKAAEDGDEIDVFGALSLAMRPHSGKFTYESPNEPAEPVEPTSFRALMEWRDREAAKARSDDE